MILRTPEDFEMLEVLREQYAARREHRAKVDGRSAELEQVRRRLVEIDAELNIEAELAAHRLERKLRSIFPHARIAPLRRQPLRAARRQRPAASESRDERRVLSRPGSGYVIGVR